jgi:hypothetical protein
MALVACDYVKLLENKCLDFVMAKRTPVISILFTDALFFILSKERCSHRPGMSSSATGFPRNLPTLAGESG